MSRPVGLTIEEAIARSSARLAAGLGRGTGPVRTLTEDERRAYEAELLARPAKLVESRPKPPLFAWKSRSKSKAKPMPAPTTVAEPVSPEPSVPPAAERPQVEPERHELAADRRQVRRRRRRRAAPVDDLAARLDAWARESADRVVRRVLERAFGRAA